MDFAENYTCQTSEEVQSGYYDKPAVTLHPTVVYYKYVDGNLVNKSFVMLSDKLQHTSSTI